MTVKYMHIYNVLSTDSELFSGSEENSHQNICQPCVHTSWTHPELIWVLLASPCRIVISAIPEGKKLFENSARSTHGPSMGAISFWKPLHLK